jgi:predicted Zn-dependent peptidase
MERFLYEKSLLPGGITLLTERMPHRDSAAIGVWVKSGARDEPGELAGISHFLEHMLFKGTERRDARAIAQSLESLGGHLDAFTSREQVCFYARVLSEHLPQAVDVLADIICHSRLAEDEIRREQQVVREEILSYEDNPEDKIHDLLAETLWAGHGLGRPILGTVERVLSFSQPTLGHYYRRRYVSNNLIISATGDVEHGALTELATRHFAPPSAEPLPLSDTPPPPAACVVHVERELQQLYLVLGTLGLHHRHPDRFGLLVLNAILGGGMSSRLFQSVREEAGLAYSIFSSTEFFRDTGLLFVSLGVSPGRGREALGRVREEMLRLAGDGPSEDEVCSGKLQLKGNILLSQESVSNRMHQLALEEIFQHTHRGPEAYVAQVMAVTRDDVVRLAREFLRPERYSLVALGPADGEPFGAKDWC